MNPVALFTPLYLDGTDPMGSSRLERNIRYVRWYESIQEKVGFDDIWMFDNGSSEHLLERFQSACPNVKIERAPHLGRSEEPHGYQYLWRALWFLNDLISRGYGKIVAIDSDSFVVSERMAKHIKELQKGWEVMYERSHDCPAAEVHILCAEAFGLFKSYTSRPWQEKIGKWMERELPFTKVNKDLNCDRWGLKRTPQTPEMDGYFQAAVDQPLVFNMKDEV